MLLALPGRDRVAYRRRDPAQPDDDLWRLYVLDLRTMAETPIAERRGIDDQTLWLDGRTLAYAMPSDSGSDLWSVPTGGSGAGPARSRRARTGSGAVTDLLQRPRGTAGASGPGRPPCPGGVSDASVARFESGTDQQYCFPVARQGAPDTHRRGRSRGGQSFEHTTSRSGSVPPCAQSARCSSGVLVFGIVAGFAFRSVGRLKFWTSDGVRIPERRRRVGRMKLRKTERKTSDRLGIRKNEAPGGPV
nr:hypothetical protein KPHV_72810 [Kitasatospora purpeofusca]